IQLLRPAQLAASAIRPLISASANETPISECVDHCSNIFNNTSTIKPPQPRRENLNIWASSSSSSSSEDSPSPSPSQQTYATPPDETTLLASGLADRISVDKIRLHIQQMSTSTSPGNDGITVSMLQHLLDTTFP